jgi:hypothetical protein
MATRRLLRYSALLFGALPAFASGQMAPDDAAGCYDLFLGSWLPAEPGGDSMYYALPTRMHLSVTHHEYAGDSSLPFTVTEAPGAMPSIHRYSGWGIEGDSLLMIFTTGFAGVSVRVAGLDTLRGTASTFSHGFGTFRRIATVEAPRVDCASTLEESRRAAYRYSPVVRLAEGDSLVLAGPVDASLVADRPTRMSVIVTDQPLPPYEECERVELWLREADTISSIRLHCAPGVDFEHILAKLHASLGSPTHRSVIGARPSAAWSSRLIVIQLLGGVPGGDRGAVISLRSPRHD